MCCVAKEREPIVPFGQLQSRRQLGAAADPWTAFANSSSRGFPEICYCVCEMFLQLHFRVGFPICSDDTPATRLWYSSANVIAMVLVCHRTGLLPIFLCFGVYWRLRA